MVFVRAAIVILFFTSFLISCSSRESEQAGPNAAVKSVFTSLPASETGISFSNSLTHDEQLNTYTYRNFYNGAGVAIGDINNDGLADLYFAGNQSNNKLYLNQGAFTFEDITESAGVACANVWSTGVSMADVNGDGYLDIYVCKSGPPEGDNRQNELFINNGDLTFTEQGAKWGVDDKGLSNHAVFFDYDRDGDLDIYLLNNSLRSIGIYDLRTGQREIRDPEGGNKLYRNDGDTFSDVSEQAGIYGSAIGFGLGVTVADVNRDMWPDIFVSNDFFERDYLYINNQDGTFREEMTSLTTESSMGSMGADIADLNNDGYPEIYVSEMLPASLERIKTKTVFENWDKYQSNVKSGYAHQFTRNVLQLNNGPQPDNPSNVSFSEVSRLSGTHATDWSWGALLFDVDNDGLRDIFVANGIYKDLTDQDYINFYSNNEILISRHKKDSSVLTTLIDKIPSVPLANALFLNKGEMEFEDISVTIPTKGFSNGAAYGDLDNDGDLDLVVNNINTTALVYRNNGSPNAYLQLDLRSHRQNTGALGAFVTVYTDEGIKYAEHQPVKGYMSSMDPVMHVGLGKAIRIDSAVIQWPLGATTVHTDFEANNRYDLEEPSVSAIAKNAPSEFTTLLKAVEVNRLNSVVYQENDFNDFNRDQLLFEMYSNEGPAMEIGDLNGDGREDIVLGGASGYSLRIFYQEASGDFHSFSADAFEKDKRSEDAAIALLDYDGDGDLDIYVGSGGNEFSLGDPALKDRLYRNENGSFTRDDTHYPRTTVPAESTGFVLVKDLNGDGVDDLIIGHRLEAFQYGRPASARVLLNNDRFEDATAQVAPDFNHLGLLTDAVWMDVDDDKKEELVVVGEWMAPAVFKFQDDQWRRTNLMADIPAGLYKSAYVTSVNDQPVLILGNHGLNSRLVASEDSPLTMHVNDYDENGRLDHILSIGEEGILYPLNLLQDLSKQIPKVRKTYTTFADYGGASTEDILRDMNREGETRLEVTSLASLVVHKKDNGWSYQALPWQAQISPVFAIYSEDFNNDGHQDIMLGGNQSRAKPELGIYQASYGLVLAGNADGGFSPMSQQESGIKVNGEIRALRSVDTDRGRILVVGRNNDALVCYE